MSDKSLHAVKVTTNYLPLARSLSYNDVRSSMRQDSGCTMTGVAAQGGPL